MGALEVVITVTVINNPTLMDTVVDIQVLGTEAMVKEVMVKEAMVKEALVKEAMVKEAMEDISKTDGTVL